ncbi:aa3-type cytochrome c oxidase subunit IV [Paracoccus jeotgali]|uniref:Aa3-type cytochrome c oxidase subunit IV n=2 Tax=Paracoccus jeotgali TaxID=2065379 RepID=A0A2K9MJ42_9RHOB|nr:aa3-type cytochrome c oxidase subunit IV [Paracoccus jeotgali]AUM75669.1 aa3-type cytochrome c oxidase subunit IV [Paracoccus jeotgali]
MAEHNQTDHVHGEMEIREHQKTFAGFVRLAMWACIISLLVLVFMALTNA